ncbi:uncharacterized protein LOC130918547 [Corythoichthys intestinalis]|uniref:uncharacterized protein LOC130918547 n=1 Tax=Corythoichthys intestinalis TaxID=161448 RepID=UPI0025A67B3E|nr:uncharacterized protein LOC130918547 [Corythoichthys intestinalis]
MCKVRFLRALVKKRLDLAVEEIFELFERTIEEYEEELSRTKAEKERQRELLDAALKIRVPQNDAEMQPRVVDIPEVPPEKSGGPAQPPQLKNKEFSGHTAQPVQGLQEEADVMSTDVDVKKEADEAQSSQLYDSQSNDFGQNMMTDAEHLDFAPLSDIDDVISHSSDTEHSDHAKEALATKRKSTAMEQDLIIFLRRRNISSERLLQMERDKIDSSVILLMSDEDLQKYVPHYGDRIALIAFCQNPTLQERSRGETDRRYTQGPALSSSSRGRLLFGNENSKRAKRRVELGWMNFDWKEKRYKQVRTAKGGGTRSLSIDKNKTVAEIKTMAEDLFLTNVELSDFQTRITDFAERQVDSTSTVEKLYEITNARLLRLYLCTKQRVQDDVKNVLLFS